MQTTEKSFLINSIIFFALAVIYVLAGYIIAIIYGYFAGGIDNHLVTITILGPVTIFLIIWAGMLEVSIMLEPRGNLLGRNKFLITITLIVLALLPIMLNGASVLLNHVGAGGLAAILFAYRYDSFLIAIGLYLAFGFLALFVLPLLLPAVRSFLTSIQAWYYKGELARIEDDIDVYEKELEMFNISTMRNSSECVAKKHWCEARLTLKEEQRKYFQQLLEEIK